MKELSNSLWTWHPKDKKCIIYSSPHLGSKTRTDIFPTFSCDSSGVQPSCTGAKKWPGCKVLKLSLVCNLQNRIQVSDDMKSNGLDCPWKWNSSKLFVCPFIRIVAPLRIAFSWLVKFVLKCSVDHTWKYISASLIYELSEVQVSSFYPFTVGFP